FFLFSFSSRRRHTRSTRDWSSDVCSSDLVERPAPKGDVPGEWYSPTQPFVTKPPAYDRQGVTIDDLIDFTPELRAQAVEFVKKYKIGTLFTQPVMSKVEGPKIGVEQV